MFMKAILVALIILAMFGCISQTNQNTSVPLVNTTQNQTNHTVEKLTIEQEHIKKQELTNKSQENTGVLTADTVLPEIPKFNFSNVTASEGKLIVYYFHSPYCQACIRFRSQMDRWEEKYNKSILWMEFDTTKLEGYLAYEEFSKENNLDPKQIVTPRILVNKGIMTGIDEINASLENILSAYQSQKQSK